MNIHDLAILDWHGSVPSLEGDANRSAIENFASIIGNLDSSSDASIVKNKCLEFTNSIQDAHDFYKAANIFNKAFPGKEVSITFSDGSHSIPHYQLRALEMDFPDSNIKNALQNISHDEYVKMIDHLYPISENKISEDKWNELSEILARAGLFNSFRFYRSFGAIPVSFSKDKVDELLFFLNKDLQNDDQTVSAVATAILLLSELDPTNRQDLLLALDLFKAVETQRERLVTKPKYNSEVAVQTFDKKKKEFVNKELRNTGELSVFQKFKKTFATFFGLSINNWVAVDRTFLLEALKEANGLSIEIPENAHPEFWEWLKQSDNVESIILPKSFTAEDFESIPTNIVSIDLSNSTELLKEPDFANRVLEHLKKMTEINTLINSHFPLDTSSQVLNDYREQSLAIRNEHVKVKKLKKLSGI